MICPRCNSEIQQRFACTNCGLVIGVRCLMPKCLAVNPAGAKFCGDCGFPISRSLKEWNRFLGWGQQVRTHPHRNLIFFTTVAAGILSFGGVMFLVAGLRGAIHNLFLDWRPLATIVVFPPILGVLCLWSTRPLRTLRWQFTVAVFYGVFGIWFFWVLSIAVVSRLTGGP
jgi:hypothetical protein